MKKNSLVPILITLLVLLGIFFYRESLVEIFEKAVPSRSNNLSNYDGFYESCPYEKSCNFLEIKTLSSGKTLVQGSAYWQGKLEGQVNTGNIAGEINIRFQKAYYEKGECKIDLLFSDSQVQLKERVGSICGGLNVFFDGIYSKIDQMDKISKGISVSNFSGKWQETTIGTKAPGDITPATARFTLNINQDKDKIWGTHCAELVVAGRIDCSDEISFNGQFFGDKALIKIASAYGSGSYYVELTLASGGKLQWRMIQTIIGDENLEHALPFESSLKRQS